MFFLRKKFWLIVGKCVVLLFVLRMIRFQFPELQYDFGSKQPVQITGPEQLKNLEPAYSTFVSVHGSGNFDTAFVYSTHGISFSYFTLKPYGIKILVRAFKEVTDDWKNINTFVGRLKPYHKMPFSRTIGRLFQERFGVPIPADSYVLFYDDVPGASGWQIGAVVFGTIMFFVLIFLFFFYKPRLKPAGALYSEDKNEPVVSKIEESN